MNRAMALGMITGIVFGLLVVAVLILVSRKKYGKAGCNYDERQELARGKSFKIAFFSMIVYFLFSGMFTLFTGIQWADPVVEDFIGFLFGLTIFIMNAIFRDAYLGLHENYKSSCLILAVLCAMNAIAAFTNPHGIIEQGQLTYRSMNLCIVIAFFCMLIALIMKMMKDKKAEDNE